MAKERMPFELARPDANTPVTNASEIDYADIPLECALVYDISVAKAVNNVPAQYESLSAAFGTNGANIPQDIRREGMSIKFVQSSDSKYVQYMYHGTSTAVADFTNTANWEKMNLEDEISEINNGKLETFDKEEVRVTDIQNWHPEGKTDGYYNTENGTWLAGYDTSARIDVSGYEQVRFRGTIIMSTGSLQPAYAFQDENGDLLTGYPKCYQRNIANTSTRKEYILDIPTEAKYFVVVRYSDFYCYLRKGLSVKDRFDNVNRINLNLISTSYGFLRENGTIAGDAPDTIKKYDIPEGVKKIYFNGHFVSDLDKSLYWIKNAQDTIISHRVSASTEDLYNFEIDLSELEGATQIWTNSNGVPNYIDSEIKVAGRLLDAENNISKINTNIQDNPGAFDISKYNAVSGVSKAYPTLSDALAVFPSAYYGGGISIKFILQKYTVARNTQSEEPTGTELQVYSNIISGNNYTANELSDSFSTLPTTEPVIYYISDGEETPTYTKWVISANELSVCEYVQDRYIGVTTDRDSMLDVKNWQEIDNTITKDSINLPTSGAVFEKTKYIENIQNDNIQEDEIVFEDNDGNEVCKISKDGADFKALTVQGSHVAIAEESITDSQKDEIIFETDNGEVICKIDGNGADFKALTVQGTSVALAKETKIGSQKDELIFEDNDGNEVGKINKDGADFKALTVQGNPVSIQEETKIGEKEEALELKTEDGEIIVKINKERTSVGMFRADYVEVVNDVEKDDLIRVLQERINTLENSISPLYDLKIKENTTKRTITLADNSGGKYLISLHRKDNDHNYGTANSVYLPNARKDFSDIRVYGANGTTYPYKVLYNGDIDVVPAPNLNVLTGAIMMYNDILYCGSNNGRIYYSSDGGYTWSIHEDLSSNLAVDMTYVTLITSGGDLFIGNAGKLYKSSYPYTAKSIVLDENTLHSGSTILSTSVTQDGNGNIYVGHYQGARDIIIEKSTDGGDTFSIVYRDDSGKYQHVHRIEYDDVTGKIYAGLDGGGGVLVSSDGVNFTDLRGIYDIPQSTDYGVAYSESGFRLLSGETSIVGGSTLIKTTDDENFEAVLDAGKSCYFVKKMGNILIANLLSSNNMKTSQLVYSEDNGNTWKLLYATSVHNDNGASDGFRELSKLTIDGEEVLFAIKQGSSFDSLRITKNASNSYAQIMVEVPAGVSEIYVEDGYAARKTTEFSFVPITGSLFYAPLNSLKGDYYVNGNKYKGNVPEIVRGGRQIADLYPAIREFNDRYSAKFVGIDSFAIANLTIPENFHIGFWMRSSDICDSFVLMETEGFTLKVYGGRNLVLNSALVGYVNVTDLENVFIRVDINFTANSISVYTNTIEQYLDNQSGYTGTVPSIPANAEIQFLKKTNMDGVPFVIQHLEINSGIMSVSDIQKRYSDGLKDNK